VKMGRKAGTIQWLPEPVAARMVENDQAEHVSARDAAEAERIRDGDPEIETQDPKSSGGRRR
jgi:hypothetical protein